MGKGTGSYGGAVKHMKAMDAGSLEELSRYMSDTYGVGMDRTLEQIDFDVARSLTDGIENMLKEFPGLDAANLRLSGRLRGDSSYAGTTVDGEVLLHPGVLSSVQKTERLYQHDLDSGYHPAGTSYVNIVIHEMGHQIEGALIRRQIPGNDRESRVARADAWRSGTVAADLVGRALDRTAPGWQKNQKLAAAQVERISKYAAVDASETVAEAISDYYSNRRNASPLSKEIWRLAKKELG
ncbi:MAG: hypothetical protein IJ242_11070 [Clostridia bacterium]|nr:hypothetical protein [Clostridia bacterium]